MTTQKGFMLMEALILILIIAVTFTAFLGLIGKSLKVSSRGRALTDAVLKYEFNLFEFESGFRDELPAF